MWDEAIEIDVNHLLDEDAGVGVHDESRAVRGVASDPGRGGALVFEVTARRRRRKLDAVALEEALVQGCRRGERSKRSGLKGCQKTYRVLFLKHFSTREQATNFSV